MFGPGSCPVRLSSRSPHSLKALLSRDHPAAACRLQRGCVTVTDTRGEGEGVCGCNQDPNLFSWIQVVLAFGSTAEEQDRARVWGRPLAPWLQISSSEGVFQRAFRGAGGVSISQTCSQPHAGGSRRRPRTTYGVNESEKYRAENNSAATEWLWALLPQAAARKMSRENQTNGTFVEQQCVCSISHNCQRKSFCLFYLLRRSPGGGEGEGGLHAALRSTPIKS